MVAWNHENSRSKEILPDEFNPEEFKKKQIKLDAVVDYAAKIEDAELLENASRKKS